jgi:hypothetical protein
VGVRHAAGKKSEILKKSPIGWLCLNSAKQRALAATVNLIRQTMMKAACKRVLFVFENYVKSLLIGQN